LDIITEVLLYAIHGHFEKIKRCKALYPYHTKLGNFNIDLNIKIIIIINNKNIKEKEIINILNDNIFTLYNIINIGNIGIDKKEFSNKFIRT